MARPRRPPRTRRIDHDVCHHPNPRPADPSPAKTVKPTALVAPKGVPDYFPPTSRAFIAVRDTLIRAADRAGYAPIELPLFEDTALFARGVGESTDVVSKEMYSFADRGGRSVTLRPEGTAGVMRAVIEHGLDRGPLPVKLVYAGAVLPVRAAASGAVPAIAAGRHRGHR